MEILDFIVELGLDAGLKYFKNRLNTNKLKDSLRQYIINQEAYNELSSLEEEIDFQGLAAFIETTFMEKVDECIFSVSIEQRSEARRTLIDAAVAYSKAETEEAKQRVTKCVTDILAILHSFYANDVPQENYLLAAEVVDAVDENTERHIAGLIANQNNNHQQVMEALNENARMMQSIIRRILGIDQTTLDAYKKVRDDYVSSPEHSLEEKICFAENCKRKIVEQENCLAVINLARDGVNEDSNPSQVDEDWFTFFFDKVSKTSNESIQLVMSKILKEEVNNPDTVTRSLVQALSVISRRQLKLFCNISKYCLDEYDIEQKQTVGRHLFLFIAEAPTAYSDQEITWEGVKELERLGLVICDSTTGFALKGHRVFKKKSMVVDVVPDKNGRIPTGNVIFTPDGKKLYEFLDDVYKGYFRGIFNFTVNHLNEKGCRTLITR